MEDGGHWCTAFSPLKTENSVASGKQAISAQTCEFLEAALACKLIYLLYVSNSCCQEWLANSHAHEVYTCSTRLRYRKTFRLPETFAGASTARFKFVSLIYSIRLTELSKQQNQQQEAFVQFSPETERNQFFHDNELR
ncbi:hypothetical protein M514_02110 [Trichuris suis]|uniref:Uncharacterized protein n=1 Tax=Trichuris suis TaxID=68888 RepID=A0A085MWY0_9BILA|nr:hypothetical protein M513_02110 [Trichuris suis]KFD61726.1 hypothetical protein M514_02110 [Trichuris suis]